MEFINAYTQAIAISLIIIISYFFNYISKKTNIPSVLLLIATGIGIKICFQMLGIQMLGFINEALELLGVIGLIMIVLEAALDLKLEREKRPLLIKSLLIALFGLIITALVTATIFQIFIFNKNINDINEAITYQFNNALVYAIPLSILSSAIIIPSVGSLVNRKKEFLVFESTFSDIFGIMFFYFVIGQKEEASVLNIATNVSLNIVFTIILSLVIGYSMVLLLQRLQSKLKLFFLISILILIYSIGKLSHLSSLLIIMVFGLILNNYKVFFVGKAKKLINKKVLKDIVEDFHTVTLETAFVIRTFFFVIFGITLDFAGITELEPILISLGILGFTYFIRFSLLKGLVRKNISPQLWVAPRGLITVLLFFSIPEELQSPLFNPTILLLVILISNFIMTAGLISKRREYDDYNELSFENWEQLDDEVKKRQIVE